MKKFAAALMAASFLGLATGAKAAEEGKLLVWIIGDKAVAGLQELGKKFEADTGIPVAVEPVPNEGGTDKWEQAAAAGKGPDVFIWPHDRLGTWTASGLLSPIEPSAEVKDAVLPVAWEAFTQNGQIWGYPISVEAVGLLYNKDLIPTPPETFDDVRALSAKLRPENKWAFIMPTSTGAISYFSWGILAANGAQVFEKDAGGSLDVKKTGLNSQSAIQGAQLIKSLIDEGVMPSGADYGVMDSAFAKGEAAMIVNGPWSWSNYKDVNFGVALIPAVGSEKGRPFVGVLGAMVNKNSPNKDLVKEFFENYVLTAEGQKVLNDDKPLGVPANKAFADELSADEKIAGMRANAERGTPMPNVPEMGKYWPALQSALENIYGGRQTVEEALNDAAKRVVE